MKQDGKYQDTDFSFIEFFSNSNQMVRKCQSRTGNFADFYFSKEVSYFTQRKFTTI